MPTRDTTPPLEYHTGPGRPATPDDIGRIIWHAYAPEHGYRITTISSNGRLVFGLPVKKKWRPGSRRSRFSTPANRCRENKLGNQHLAGQGGIQ